MSSVALILGAGGNIGQHVGKALAAKGYRVALAARSAKADNDTTDLIHVQSDLNNPESVSQVFETVKTRLGHPSVVIYNAAAAHFNDPKNPFSITLSEFQTGVNVNTVSTWAAAKKAAESFQELPESASRTFIYTGNMLNTKVMLPLVDLGVGKSASAHFIEAAAEAFKDKGFKFYYADERKADGSPVGNAVDGPAHAEHYLSLIESASQGPWSQTFVKGVGYKDFSA